MANSNSKAAEQAAEQALRNLLINMRKGTNANHTQALANFKAAVQAYNRAQVIAVNAVNKAIGDPTARNVNGAAGALGNVLKRVDGLRQAAAAAAEETKVQIGKNNFKVTRNNNGKIVKLKGRGGEYHQFGTQNEKNYVQLENGAWYQLGNTSLQKYNKNNSGKFVKKQGFLGRVGGAVGGTLGGLFGRRSAPVKRTNEEPLLGPPNKRN